jgi:hypothetical protein
MCIAGQHLSGGGEQVKIVVMKVEKIQAAGWVPSRTPTAEQRGG